MVTVPKQIEASIGTGLTIASTSLLIQATDVSTRRMRKKKKLSL